MSVRDDDLYRKGYGKLEKQYPEVRSARYREEVVKDEKWTTLTVRCDHGALSLAGRLEASQFREWCLDRLGEVLDAVDGLRAQPVAWVNTVRLATVPEMNRLGTRRAVRKNWAARIIGALLAAKTGPEHMRKLLEDDESSLELAAEMGDALLVQIPLRSEEKACQEREYVACGGCPSTVLRVLRGDGSWRLECGAQAYGLCRWSSAVPLRVLCDEEHGFTLDEDYLSQHMELLPSGRLLETVASVVNTHLCDDKRGYALDPDAESFYIRGQDLIYAARKQVLRVADSMVHVDITVWGDVHEGANIIGVSIAKLLAALEREN
jgi:hypothetical protein